jgi:heme A synthase
VNTFLLLGSLTLTAWWSGRKDARMEWKTDFQSISLVVALLGVTIVGMTGAITALGDTLFPASSLAEGIRQDFSPTAHFLIRLRVWHPLLSVFVGVYIIFISGLAVSENKNNRANSFGWGLIVLVLTQLLAGIVNLILLAPLWMQIVHLLLADLVWIVLVLFTVNLLSPQRVANHEEAVGAAQQIIETR